MKLVQIILLILSSSINCYSQFELDTAKLALLGKDEISLKQIKKADSLLVESVNYYNSKVDRGYNLISLTDIEYQESQTIDSIQNFISLYLKKDGKIKKQELNKLAKKEQEVILTIISNKDSLSSRIKILKENGKPNWDDSLVTSWGEGSHIEISEYYRQYQYYADNSGIYLIRVSCFCPHIIESLDKTPIENRINWKKQPLKGNDGGSCIFTVKLNLKNNTASDFRVNGM